MAESLALAGKSAIVTGAGINLEFARLLLQNGADVLFADLTLRPEAQALVDEYQSKIKGPSALFQRTDVTSWTDLNSMFEIAEERFGSIDIVCPGAGVFEPAFSGFWSPPGKTPSRDDPSGDRYTSLDINLVHPIRTTQLAISRFLADVPRAGRTDRKTIVHILSVAAEVASMPFPLYHASKWGLRGFLYSLASLEEEKRIRVAGVAPGAVITPLWTDNPDKMRMVEGEGQVQEWVTPVEVAQVMLSIVTKDEVQAADGAKVPIRGGSLIEVTKSDVRDVPMLDNSGFAKVKRRGLTAVNGAVKTQEAFEALAQPGWGQWDR